LSYNENYGQFSNVFTAEKYDSKMALLKDPEQLLQDGYSSFAAAMWFYMTPQNPKPSMHDVMTGLYTPNAVDEAAGIKGGFGTTTNIINGGIECGSGGAEQVKAQARADYFIKFLQYFGIDESTEENLGCANEKSFPSGGTGSLAKGYFKPSTKEGECELVAGATQYSLYARDDYKRCVCETHGDGEESCPQATASTTGLA